MSLAERIDERYSVQQLIHENPPWTRVWQVIDEQGSAQPLVMKRLAIPPLRAELEPRLEALKRALVRLEQNQSPLLANILGFFQRDNEFFIVMERAPGKPMNDLLERHKLVVEPDQLTEAAVRIARGLRQLVDTRQWMALEEFGPEMLMVTGDGEIRFINFGLSQYLRPRFSAARGSSGGVAPPAPTSAWEDPDASPDARKQAESTALRAYGQLLYAMWTRVPAHRDQVVDIDALPEALQTIVGRCVQRSQPDAYGSVADLQADLDLLQVVHAHDISRPQWYLPEETPLPWEESGVTHFIRRSGAIAASPLKTRFRSLSQPRRLVVVALLAVLGGLLGNDLYQRFFTAGPYVKRGAVVYVATDNGRLEIWSAADAALLKTVDVGEEISAMIYNPRLHRLFLGLPAERRIMAVDVDKGRLLGYTTVGTGVRSMIADPLRPVALCLSHESNLARVGLRRLQVLDAVETHCVPLAAMFNAQEKLVVVSADAPPALRVHTDAAWSECLLDYSPVTAALNQATDEVWVAEEGSDEQSQIHIYSATTLALKRAFKVALGHVSEIQFDGESIYLIRKDPGLIVEVDGASGATKHSVTVAGGIHAMAIPTPSALWVATTARHVLVINPASGNVTRTLETGGVPVRLQFVP